MSKYILRKHVSGFTIVSNNVIKALNGDLEALGLYVYLLSLPNEWEFYKTQLCKSCSIGIKKLEKLLKKLSLLNLVRCGQKRDKRGRFTDFYLDIFDTETLPINELQEEVQSVQPVGHSCRTVKTVRRSGEAIKEEVKKEEQKEKEIKEREAFSENQKKEKSLSQKNVISDSFTPTDKHESLAAELQINLTAEKDKFIDYYKAHGKKMSNWNAAFNNWLRKCSEFNPLSYKKEHSVTRSIQQLKEKSPEFRQFLLS